MYNNDIMLFLNRFSEIERLEKVTNQPESAFLVIWGRRRVGKTRLLLEWLKNNQGLYWVADESSAIMQRRYFCLALEQRLPGFSQFEYSDWGLLFERLAKEAKLANWRGPLVIDEFPYLVATSPELPSILQRFIDHDAKNINLLFAISGSNQRLMQGLVLNSDEPLYGRAQEIIKLMPLKPKYLQSALQLATARKTIEAYSVWGGIPRYWELATVYKQDINEAIDAIVLNPQGILHEEPMRLLLEESPPAIALRPILDAIGSGVHKLSEIAGRLNLPSTSLSRPLERLRDLGYIEREIPFGTSEKDTKRALYKIKDPFLRFWFHVVAPKRSALSQIDKEARLMWLEEKFPVLQTQAWEDLCRNSIPHLRNRLNNIVFEPAKRFWHGTGPEWDIVSESFNKKILLLGEAKWLDKTPSVQNIERILQELMSKGTVNQSYETIYYVIFVPEKPKEPMKLSENVFVLDANDVIQ
jgi:AAA+ ATPase superfamily predicted ATPase